MSPTHPSTHPGDDGNSDLIGGTRLSKDHAVFECLGQIDELSSAIGVLRCHLQRSTSEPDLRTIQLALGRLMAAVATPGERDAVDNALTSQDADHLEALEASLRSTTRIGSEFVIPGDTTAASALADVARAKCRTAERAFVRFLNAPLPATENATTATGGSDGSAQRYLNRLSTYLFVLARHLDEAAER